MSTSKNIDLRPPTLKDGMQVFKLIQHCPPLDTNSSYCNFLQSGHFASTSVAAELNGDLVGFVSGYCIPERPDTLFYWQAAVDTRARGTGLASRMLMHILSRPSNSHIRYIETTITKDNDASWALFRRLAAQLNAEMHDAVWLDRETHFEGQHDSEMLVRIGPFTLEQPGETS